LATLIFSSALFGSHLAVAESGVEAIVRASFADAPIMIRVAECESKFRQFADSGNVLRGGWEGKMVGIFQVYDDIHREAATNLGFDIDTVQGNIGYARYLYTKQGTDPWISSFSCWNDKTTEGSSTPQTVASPAVTTAAPAAASGALTSSLSFGTIDPQVLLLQQLLNAAGFTITSSGPGSPGQETTKFGSLTRDAVRRFQCARSIACSGDEYTNGYGFVGPRTRMELLTLAPNTPTVAPPATPAASAPAAPSSKTLEINSLKVQIAELQKRLAELEAGF
jgi:hypothetical protein